MTLPDGPTLMGVAAIITAATGMITALRATANRPRLRARTVPARLLERLVRRSGGRTGVGGHGG